MTIGAFANVRIAGGYSRVISEPNTYQLVHQIKNCQHAERMRLDLEILRGEHA